MIDMWIWLGNYTFMFKSQKPPLKEKIHFRLQTSLYVHKMKIERIMRSFVFLSVTLRHYVISGSANTEIHIYIIWERERYVLIWSLAEKKHSLFATKIWFCHQSCCTSMEDYTSNFGFLITMLMAPNVFYCIICSMSLLLWNFYPKNDL